MDRSETVVWIDTFSEVECEVGRQKGCSLDGSRFQYESESQESPWRLLYFYFSVLPPLSPLSSLNL
jgi:hypothetical protein